MTDEQWVDLLGVVDGENRDLLPVGFLVDAPWFAARAGVSLRRYFTDNETWLQANVQAANRFPDVLWIPGFWAEFGMASNPVSFGCKVVWPEDGFPACERVLRDTGSINQLLTPDVRTDGLLPLIIERLRWGSAAIEQAGHKIRFATSHGPLTIAGYLLGHTEFFLGMRTEPAAIHRLLRITTDFVIAWLRYQIECFPSIDGVLVMEDFLGFLGEQDFLTFGCPYMGEVFTASNVRIRFLHNDAAGKITARHLGSMNVNMFNFSHEHPIAEIRALAGDEVTLVGNLPPRDVLGAGTPEDVGRCVRNVLDDLQDKRRLILSAGGFTPAGLCADKLAMFLKAASHPLYGCEFRG